MDRELLKEALVKRARVNPSTYPISRFLTNPWTAAVGLGSLGAAAGPYAPIAIPALGAVGYGATKLKRWLKARALMSRGTREIATDQPTMMEFERDALYKILEGKKVQKAASEKTAKISPRVMKTLGQAFRETPDYPVMYPFSEIATSRAVKGGLSGGRAVAQSGSAEEAMWFSGRSPPPWVGRERPSTVRSTHAPWRDAPPVAVRVSARWRRKSSRRSSTSSARAAVASWPRKFCWVGLRLAGLRLPGTHSRRRRASNVRRVPKNRPPQARHQDHGEVREVSLGQGDEVHGPDVRGGHHPRRPQVRELLHAVQGEQR